MRKLLFIALLFLSINLLAAGPGVSKNGSLIRPDQWVKVKITNEQLEILNKERIITLSQNQLKNLGIKNKQNYTINLLDYFDLRDCTCGDVFWGIWDEKWSFSINKRNIKKIQDKIKLATLASSKNLDMRAKIGQGEDLHIWDPYTWMQNNLIIGMKGNIYHQGKILSKSEINKIKETISISLIKLSPKIVPLVQQELILDIHNLLDQ